MATEWYYACEGQSVGPVSIDELRRLADSGELQRTDLVWTSPMKEWEEAGGFGELFPPAVSTESASASAPPPAATATPESQTTPHAPRAEAQYEGRGRGGHAGRGGRGGYYGPRREGVPPIVLVGFIISIAGIAVCAPLSIIGTVLCMIGLSEAKRRQEGVGLAIAGIVIGLIMFALGIIGLIFFIAMSGSGGHF